MVEFLVLCLTLVPTALGAIHGFRAGGDRLVVRWGPIILSWAVGVASAFLSFRAGLFEPFGLVTPLLVGVLVATSTTAVLYRVVVFRMKRESSPPGSATRLVGALAGLVGGLVIASSAWLGLVAIDGWRSVTPSCAPPSEQSLAGEWLHSLVRTANRGFLRHLPMVAPLSDEIEALLFILNADPVFCEKLASERGWKELRTLPSFQAIIADGEILDEIDSVSGGNLAALYRLQRNAKVIAFVVDEEVQTILTGVRPSILARELEAMMAPQRKRPESVSLGH